MMQHPEVATTSFSLGVMINDLEKVQIMRAGKVVERRFFGESWITDRNPSWDWYHYEYRVTNEDQTPTEETLHKASVIEAFNQGKKVEATTKDGTLWITVHQPTWNFQDLNYREKNLN